MMSHVGTILNRNYYTKSSSFSSGLRPTNLHYVVGAKTFNFIISEPIINITSTVYSSTETNSRVIGINSYICFIQDMPVNILKKI